MNTEQLDAYIESAKKNCENVLEELRTIPRYLIGGNKVHISLHFGKWLISYFNPETIMEVKMVPGPMYLGYWLPTRSSSFYGFRIYEGDKISIYSSAQQTANFITYKEIMPLSF